MATPTGDRATRVRRYQARERRRLKQNQSAFVNAGYVAAPFDFGAMLVGQDSPNSLQLPADANLALRPSVAMVPGDLNIGDDLETYAGAESVPAGGFTRIRHIFRKDRTIVITRGDTAPSGTVLVYLQVRSQYIQIGTVTYT